MLRKTEMETSMHLFFACSFSNQIIRTLLLIIGFNCNDSSWGSITNVAIGGIASGACIKNAYRAVVNLAIYYIWRERNRRLFNQ
uniref:Reverse transcriptase zinc-binding domain-containing protein n=1 Tax=Kalanchoe fedtschenkoi TaxID=63787 RepID=A0A7N0RJN0_KALFE